MTTPVRKAAVRGGLVLGLAVITPAAMLVFGSPQSPVSRTAPEAWTAPVPRASCGPRDRREAALQGQTTIAERMTGASERGYNCNLELVGQFRGEGASWQMAAFDTCAYYGTTNGPGQKHRGVVVIDASNPAKPIAAAYLDARPMWDPWESLKVNVPRKLLAAVQADGGAGKEPGFAVYDISRCAAPILKAAVTLPVDVKGHAGDFTPDGFTYYGTHIARSVYSIDLRDLAAPKLVLAWGGDRQRGNLGLAHDLSLDPSGTRLYSARVGGSSSVELSGAAPIPGDPPDAPANGLVITDVSDIQNRRSDPRPRVLGRLLWKDGAGAQSPIRFLRNGHPYILFTDELGAGGVGQGRAACAQRLPPFGFARIIDIADETKPALVSQLKLEVHDPANCDAVAPDTSFSSVLGYSSHYCTIDNPMEAHYAACSYFEAGIRVFDIRDPFRPKEIAYYKPPAAQGAIPGSNHAVRSSDRRTADWASSNLRWLRRGSQTELWFTSQDNGFQIVRFTNTLKSIGTTMAGRDPMRDAR